MYFHTSLYSSCDLCFPLLHSSERNQWSTNCKTPVFSVAIWFTFFAPFPLLLFLQPVCNLELDYVSSLLVSLLSCSLVSVLWSNPHISSSVRLLKQSFHFSGYKSLKVYPWCVDSLSSWTPTFYYVVPLTGCSNSRFRFLLFFSTWHPPFPSKSPCSSHIELSWSFSSWPYT